MFGHSDSEPLNKTEKILLDEVHKAKIDVADEIFVIDVDGYIGESTKHEIEFAISKNKKVRYYSEEVNNFLIWKNDFYNRREKDINWNN